MLSTRQGLLALSRTLLLLRGLPSEPFLEKLAWWRVFPNLRVGADLSPSLSKMSPESHSLWFTDLPAPVPTSPRNLPQGRGPPGADHMGLGNQEGGVKGGDRTGSSMRGWRGGW